jgi:hypothetical protein
MRFRVRIDWTSVSAGVLPCMAILGLYLYLIAVYIRYR